MAKIKKETKPVVVQVPVGYTLTRYHCGNCRKVWERAFKDPLRTMVMTCPKCQKYARQYIYMPRPLTGNWRDGKARQINA